MATGGRDTTSKSVGNLASATEEMTLQDSLPNIFQFTALLGQENEIATLQKLGLLKTSVLCKNCNQKMQLQVKQREQDGYILRCTTCRGRPESSIRRDSLVMQAKIPLTSTAMLMYLFCADTPQFIAFRFMAAEVSKKSVSTWYELFRNVCSFKMNSVSLFFESQDVQLFSRKFETQLDVEFDESFFGKKRKNNKGSGRRKFMVFGIVEKAGKKCLLRLVETNSKEVLWPIIKKHISTDCRLFHDGLATYTNLHTEGYQHLTVNHSVELVTSDSVHTNTIEGLWGLVKQRISSQHGCHSFDRLAAVLDDFQYRQNFKDEQGSIWKSFIEHLKEYNDRSVPILLATGSTLDD